MNYANDLSSTDVQETGEELFVKTRQELIHRYSLIVYDYLAIMNSSDTLKVIDSAKYIVQNGLTAITHIYKIAFYMTKNVATSADYAQKGIYCFIEYIEQTYKLGYINPSSNNSSAHFDMMDAIIFIYDKTISELKNDNSDNVEDRSGSSTFTNILSVSQSHQTHGANFLQCKTTLENFGRITSTLLWVNHPTMNLTDQMEILDAHLMDYLAYSFSLSSRSLNKDIFLFLETVQETIDMDKKEYTAFLTSLKKQMKKQEKKEIDTMTTLPACLYLKTFSGMTLKQIAEQEKWKKDVDDLAKLLFHCNSTI